MKTSVAVHFGPDEVSLGEWPIPEYLDRADLSPGKQLSVLYHALLNGLPADRYDFGISAVKAGAVLTVGGRAPSGPRGQQPAAEPEGPGLPDRSEGRAR